MSDFIEFQLPGGSKTVLSKNRIVSLSCQHTPNFPSALTIKIDGWEKPLLYQGKDAQAWYETLRDELGVDEVKPYSEPTHDID